MCSELSEMARTLIKKCLIFCWPQPLKGDEHDVGDDDINDDVSDDVDKICIFD
jgi:hypothetical protein